MHYCNETGNLMYVDSQIHYEQLEEKTIEAEKAKNEIIDLKEELEEIKKIVFSKNTNEVILGALKRRLNRN